MNDNTLHIQLTADDYLAANRLHSSWKRAVLIYAIGAIVIGAMPYYTDDFVYFDTDVLRPLAFYAAAIAVIYLVTRYLYLPWRTRRLYRQQKSLHRPQTVSWDNEYFSVQSDEFSVRSPWADYLKWRENDRLFLLYLTDVMFRILPKRAFSGEGAIRAFRELLREKVDPKQNRKRPSH